MFTLVSAFDVFGAGNISDDLMIAGLVEAMREPDRYSRVVATSAHDIESQRLRFPSIDWVPKLDPADVTDSSWWGAIGTTAFTDATARWFLPAQTRHLELARGSRRRVMLGVGAEPFAPATADAFSAIVRMYDRIATRDESSARIVREQLGAELDRVYAGADLANLSLASLRTACPAPTRLNAVGLLLGGEPITHRDACAAARWIAGHSTTVAWIAAEVRTTQPEFEQALYERMTNGRADVRRRVELCVPGYSNGSLLDLVLPIWACDIVVSSRYHGLLAAAWGGCKVAAIGRSSKVRTLAATLDVPCCDLPLTTRKLRSLVRSARSVPESALDALRAQAERSVSFALDGGGPCP